MLSDFKEYKNMLRERTDNRIAASQEWAKVTRDRIFNMEIPPAVERTLQNRLRIVAIISTVLAAMLLIFMLPSPQHLFTALVMGIVGALVIIKWSKGLLTSSAGVLLDRAAGGEIEQQIRETISGLDNSTIQDLRIWHLDARHYAATVIINSKSDKTAVYFKQALERIPGLGFVTVEFHNALGT